MTIPAEESGPDGLFGRDSYPAGTKNYLPTGKRKEVHQRSRIVSLQFNAFSLAPEVHPG
jgi:hypothetical protein